MSASAAGAQCLDCRYQSLTLRWRNNFWFGDRWGMELRTVGGRLKLDSTFKMVATGYVVGAGVIFLPLIILVTLVSFAAGAPMTVNGEVVERGGFLTFLPIVMVPAILAMQALMFGGLVTLGLWLFQMRWPIRVVSDSAQPPPTA